jgi:hypothetical protein
MAAALDVFKVGDALRVGAASVTVSTPLAAPRGSTALAAESSGQRWGIASVAPASQLVTVAASTVLFMQGAVKCLAVKLTGEREAVTTATKLRREALAGQQVLAVTSALPLFAAIADAVCAASPPLKGPAHATVRYTAAPGESGGGATAGGPPALSLSPPITAVLTRSGIALGAFGVGTVAAGGGGAAPAAAVHDVTFATVPDLARLLAEVVAGVEAPAGSALPASPPAYVLSQSPAAGTVWAELVSLSNKPPATSWGAAAAAVATRLADLATSAATAPVPAAAAGGAGAHLAAEPPLPLAVPPAGLPGAAGAAPPAPVPLPAPATAAVLATPAPAPATPAALPAPVRSGGVINAVTSPSIRLEHAVVPATGGLPAPTVAPPPHPAGSMAAVGGAGAAAHVAAPPATVSRFTSVSVEEMPQLIARLDSTGVYTFSEHEALAMLGWMTVQALKTDAKPHVTARELLSSIVSHPSRSMPQFLRDRGLPEREELESLRRERAAWQAALDAKTADLASAVAEMERLNGQLGESAAVIARLHEALSAQQARGAALDARVAELSDMVVALRKVNETKQVDVEERAALERMRSRGEAGHEGGGGGGPGGGGGGGGGGGPPPRRTGVGPPPPLAPAVAKLEEEVREMGELESQLDDQRKVTRSLQQALGERDTTIAAMTAAHKDVDAEMQRLRDEAERLRMARDALERDRAALLTKVAASSGAGGGGGAPGARGGGGRRAGLDL